MSLNAPVRMRARAAHIAGEHATRAVVPAHAECGIDRARARRRRDSRIASHGADGGRRGIKRVDAPGVRRSAQRAARMTFADEPRAQRRVRRFFGLRGGVSAADQKVDACRFACAVARPRVEPMTAFAPESHMLRNGFFFTQGFFMLRLR